MNCGDIFPIFAVNAHELFTLLSVLRATLAACRAGSALARSCSVSRCCLVTSAWIAAT